MFNVMHSKPKTLINKHKGDFIKNYLFSLAANNPIQNKLCETFRLK